MPDIGPRLERGFVFLGFGSPKKLNELDALRIRTLRESMP